MKKFLSGVLVGALLTISGTALAANVEKIEAYFRPDFNVAVNGEVQNLRNTPVTVNGSMYLPLREVGTILGYNVEWNEQTKTAELTVPTPTQAQTKGENMAYEVIKSYYSDGKYNEDAVKVGNFIYITAVTASLKYNMPARWDDANKVLEFPYHDFQIKISDTISDQVDGFILFGRVHVKESLLENAVIAR